MRKKATKNDKKIWIIFAIVAGLAFFAQRAFSVTVKISPSPSDRSDNSGAYSGGGAGGGGGGVW